MTSDKIHRGSAEDAEWGSLRELPVCLPYKNASRFATPARILLQAYLDRSSFRRKPEPRFGAECGTMLSVKLHCVTRARMDTGFRRYDAMRARKTNDSLFGLVSLRLDLCRRARSV